MTRALLSRIAAAALLSLPLAGWFTFRTQQRLARWAADPQGAQAAYLQELQRLLSIPREVVLLLIVSIMFVLCIEGTAYLLRGGK